MKFALLFPHLRLFFVIQLESERTYVLYNGSVRDNLFLLIIDDWKRINNEVYVVEKLGLKIFTICKSESAKFYFLVVCVYLSSIWLKNFFILSVCDSYR